MFASKTGDITSSRIKFLSFKVSILCIFPASLSSLSQSDKIDKLVWKYIQFGNMLEKSNSVYPCKHQFTSIKVGFKTRGLNYMGMLA